MGTKESGQYRPDPIPGDLEDITGCLQQAGRYRGAMLEMTMIPWQRAQLLPVK